MQTDTVYLEVEVAQFEKLGRSIEDLCRIANTKSLDRVSDPQSLRDTASILRGLSKIKPTHKISNSYSHLAAEILEGLKGAPRMFGPIIELGEYRQVCLDQIVKTIIKYMEGR
jgi:pantothenate kinase